MSCDFRAIIFDFSYTLVDSSRGFVDCVNFALAEMGLPTVSAESIQRTIGMSLADTFLEVCGQRSAAQADQFAHLFVGRADEVMADLTVLLDSTAETIELLHRQGLALGIVSTSFRRSIEKILKREGLLALFETIVGGEDVSAHKPDPRGLLMAVGRLGGRRSDSLYVGDSVIDAQTAQRAAVAFVALLSGVTPKEGFSGYAAHGILDSVSDLPGLLGC